MAGTLKIGLVGPESTGKTTLGKALTAALGGICIPEFARTYVGKLDRPYTYEDVCFIAEKNKEQRARNGEADCPELSEGKNKEQGFVFFDTELIVTKVWLDEVYGKRPEWITEPIPEECQMDFYLLLCPDLPAEPDPLRENLEQSARERLFQIYLREVKSTGKPYAIISGTGEERVRSAIKAIEDNPNFLPEGKGFSEQR